MPKGQFAMGSKHPNWKGDNASYRAKHHWIVNHFGKPQECENCPSTNDSMTIYDWANISGEYKRDRSDWKRLCRKCHRKMDSHLLARGEKHGCAILTEEDIPLIWELLRHSNLTHKRIGEIFGVSHATISNILLRKKWKHIS